MDPRLTSDADSLDLAWLGRGDGGEDRRHERAQVLHAIGSGTNDDDTERERRDLLLELNTALICAGKRKAGFRNGPYAIFVALEEARIRLPPAYTVMGRGTKDPRHRGMLPC
jgi:hypothetical protein